MWGQPFALYGKGVLSYSSRLYYNKYRIIDVMSVIINRLYVITLLETARLLLVVKQCM